MVCVGPTEVGLVSAVSVVTSTVVSTDSGCSTALRALCSGTCTVRVWLAKLVAVSCRWCDPLATHGKRKWPSELEVTEVPVSSDMVAPGMIAPVVSTTVPVNCAPLQVLPSFSANAVGAANIARQAMGRIRDFMRRALCSSSVKRKG